MALHSWDRVSPATSRRSPVGDAADHLVSHDRLRGPEDELAIEAARIPVRHGDVRSSGCDDGVVPFLTLSALVFTVAAVGVMVFQAALALGAPWGAYAMGGRSRASFRRDCGSRPSCKRR